MNNFIWYQFAVATVFAFLLFICVVCVWAFLRLRAMSRRVPKWIFDVAMVAVVFVYILAFRIAFRI